ncbi:MAG TPA: PilN domain-containing protein [Patescibacteria group bacterium]|nr:PilN domain-containing protein [Patescibacteria group bacterium]
MVERKEIELIPKEIEAAKSKDTLVRRVRLFGFLFFLVSLTIFGGIFAFRLSLATRLAGLEEDSAREVASIAQFAEVESKVLGLENKSAALTKILAQRDYFSSVLAAVAASQPANLKVTGVTIQKDSVLITINGETASYVTLASFLQNLVDDGKGGKLFTSVLLSSVNQNNAKGTAEFVIEATTKKDGLKR